MIKPFIISKLNTKSKTAGYILLLLIVLFQLIALNMIGNERKGIHIDEYYSYILSNSYDCPRISWDIGSWNTWLSGNDFQKFLVVNSGEQFAYDKVYYNNSYDAHPPLFYFLLHTICSIFPEQFSAWFGMGLNIAIMIITQIILFFFCREVTSSSLWGCIPVALYGATQVFFDTAIFIRMYALLTLFSVLLVWNHYRLIKHPEKYYRMIYSFIIVFLGIFTQYYFAILAFFLALATCVYFVCKKYWKTALFYAGTMLSAVLLMFLLYPAAVTQITGSSTNNVGNVVMDNIFDFSKLLRSFGSMIEQMVKMIIPGIKLSLIPISIVATITAFILGQKHTKNFSEITFKKWFCESSSSIVLFGILIVIIAVVAHISAKYVYVRYIYNLMPLLFFSVSLLIYTTAKKFGINRSILGVGIIVVCLISMTNLVRNNKCSYLYIERTQTDNKIIQMYEDKPLVVLNNGCTYQPTSLMHFILSADDICLMNYSKIDDMNECLSQVDCENGVVFIILTTKSRISYNGNKVMTKIVKESNSFEDYKKIGSCSFSTAYLAY